MKKIAFYLPTLFLLFAFSVNAQILLPEFEEAVKLEVLNNDKAEESMPFPYMEGKNIYFVRTYIEGSMKERSKGQEIWSSNRSGGEWSRPTSLFEEANDNGNNAVIGTSLDGKMVYVFNSIQTRRRLAKGIAFTQKGEDGEWSELKKIEIPGFKAGEGVYSFYMNPTGRILLVGMAANDTSLNNDLYVSLKDENGVWGDLKSLGAEINSSGNEISPYLFKDGKTLYFSSDGHGGKGGSDIFMTYRLDDTWSNWTKPKNLEAPINSEAFDAYFIIGNNEEVFFTSNRGQEFCDIYQTKILKSPYASERNLLVSALFKYKGLPADKVKLKIYDQNGNVIDEVVTDAYGRFTYKKLNADEQYIVKLADEEEEDFVGGKMYLLDESGRKMKRLVMLEDGTFVEEETITDRVKIQGIFTYEELPRQNAALVILDENGFPLDTIYTDHEGKFEYLKMALDQNYTLIPLEVEDVLLENIGLYLTNDAGEKVQEANLNSDKAFAFTEIKEKAEIAEKTEKKEETKPTSESKIKEPEKGTVKPYESKVPKEVKSASAAEEAKPSSIGDKLMIYFNFNEWILTEDDKITLDKAYQKLKNDPSKKATVVGHTDYVGTAKNNMKVSIWRAEAAQKYLEKKGIDSSRITPVGKGEEAPIADNKTVDGRAMNRRVEVIF